MSGVKERLAALLPDAPVGAGTDAPVSVPADRLLEVAQRCARMQTTDGLSA